MTGHSEFLKEAIVEYISNSSAFGHARTSVRKALVYTANNPSNEELEGVTDRNAFIQQRLGEVDENFREFNKIFDQLSNKLVEKAIEENPNATTREVLADVDRRLSAIYNTYSSLQSYEKSKEALRAELQTNGITHRTLGLSATDYDEILKGATESRSTTARVVAGLSDPFAEFKRPNFASGADQITNRVSELEAEEVAREEARQAELATAETQTERQAILAKQQQEETARLAKETARTANKARNTNLQNLLEKKGFLTAGSYTAGTYKREAGDPTFDAVWKAQEEYNKLNPDTQIDVDGKAFGPQWRKQLEPALSSGEVSLTSSSSQAPATGTIAPTAPATGTTTPAKLDLSNFDGLRPELKTAIVSNVATSSIYSQLLKASYADLAGIEAQASQADGIGGVLGGFFGKGDDVAKGKEFNANKESYYKNAQAGIETLTEKFSELIATKGKNGALVIQSLIEKSKTNDDGSVANDAQFVANLKGTITTLLNEQGGVSEADKSAQIAELKPAFEGVEKLVAEVPNSKFVESLRNLDLTPVLSDIAKEANEAKAKLNKKVNPETPETIVTNLNDDTAAKKATAEEKAKQRRITERDEQKSGSKNDWLGAIMSLFGGKPATGFGALIAMVTNLFQDMFNIGEVDNRADLARELTDARGTNSSLINLANNLHDQEIAKEMEEVGITDLSKKMYKMTDAERSHIDKDVYDKALEEGYNLVKEEIAAAKEDGSGLDQTEANQIYKNAQTKMAGIMEGIELDANHVVDTSTLVSSTPSNTPANDPFSDTDHDHQGRG